MPKIVDHGERRGEVLEATWRVIKSRGVEAATVREIAREAGVSNGVLAHYFADKNAILIQAHQLAFDRVFDRVAERLAELSGVDLLREMLYQALPLDEDRRVEAVIDVNFLGRALNDPELKSVRRLSAENARTWWLDGLIGIRSGGFLRPDIDLDVLVDEIMVFIDGASMQAVLFPEIMTVELQKRLADALLDRVVASTRAPAR